jgi:type VI secretion system secreted protein VgrG
MSQVLDDAEHTLRLKCPVDGLSVVSVSGTEELGRLFEFHLDLISTDTEIQFSKIVGKRAHIELDMQEGTRYFDGFVTQFRMTGGDARFASYQMTLRPWLWFLTRTADCRVFQKGLDGIKTVPDIIKKVFRDNGLSDFDDRLTGSYREWIYCVQYRESDFNFISRLMEQEGIYYFFEHKAGKHTMVLMDDMGKHNDFEGNKEIPYCPPGGDMSLNKDHIQYWTVTQSIQPGQYALADYDFEKPRVKLRSAQNMNRDHANVIEEHEIFDYPGEFKVQGDGDSYVGHRLEELQAQHERVQASGPCRVLAPGCTFKLKDPPRDDQGKEMLVVSIAHSMQGEAFRSGGGTPELYNCQTELIKKAEVFRSARITPKPVVQGCQTAEVVGLSGEEIYCDKYGRVKVQFHWDRYGDSNENSSCWIRVSQLWAGKNWGGMHIPRIGQEVIVSFLEGDPDQPIITGRVYNAEQMPPYDLEANKTQSGIKSRSTKEGTPDNFNEIRMEDKIGQEELYIQAEKDETIYVKNDKDETVDHDETIEIGNDRQEKVGRDEMIAVGRNRQESVKKDETLSVGDNRTRNVGKDESVTIGQNQNIIISDSQTVTVEKDQTVDVSKLQTISVGDDRSLMVSKNRSTSVDKDDTLGVGKNLAITAGDSITIQCGKSEIIMKKDGTVTINGKDITLKGSGKITAKASSDVIIKGASVKVN